MAKVKEETTNQTKETTKTAQSTTNEEKKAIQIVKGYLVEKLPRGLTHGKKIEILKEQPKEFLREFSWEIPVFKQLEKENLPEEEKSNAEVTLKAINLLKKKGYKAYLTKTKLGGV